MTNVEVSLTHDRGKSESTVFRRRFAAGGGAGVVTKLATAPLERAKVLMQLQGMKGFIGHRSKYPSVVATLMKVTKEEGFRALYRGCGANVLRIAPAYAFKFSLNDHFKAKFADKGQSPANLRFSQLIGSSTLAGLLQTAITYPLESLRQRLYMSDSLGQSLKGQGIPHCISRTYQIEGIRGFYRGLSTGLCTGAPFIGVEMTTYELLKKFVPGELSAREKMPYHFACGAAAGVLTETVLYPLDTVWRRMMSNGEWGAPPRYRSAWHCITLTIQEDGFAGLFRGVTANATRAVPAAGIQFLAYEWLKTVLLGPVD
ncbi:Mitochondrial adenine nucleotide transporter ADNT1 [Diplonema papillatum]|nr:Mitochondrial adenine nucleotide transporter ADNT1 [Diplonema papillatum]